MISCLMQLKSYKNFDFHRMAGSITLDSTYVPSDYFWTREQCLGVIDIQNKAWTTEKNPLNKNFHDNSNFRAG